MAREFRVENDGALADVRVESSGGFHRLRRGLAASDDLHKGDQVGAG